MSRHFWCLAGLLAAFVMCAAAAGPPATCPVTRPPDPPFAAPYPQLKQSGVFLFGSEQLWTMLPTSGSWPGLPVSATGYRQKVFWWKRGYDRRAELNPQLIVTGRRLDADAPPLVASQPTNGYHENFEWFILTGVDFPVAGCWEITGRTAEDEIKFVVWVDDNSVLQPTHVAYADSMELAALLAEHGIKVLSIHASKMESLFLTVHKAAFVRTDKGIFEVIFLPGSLDAEKMEVTEQPRGNRFIYFIRSPQGGRVATINAAYRVYFIRHGSLFIQTRQPELNDALTAALTAKVAP